MIVTEEKYYSVKEIADRLRVSDETIRRFIRTGDLEAYAVGDFRISESALQAFLERRKNRRKTQK